jgi:hypothetical protein
MRILCSLFGHEEPKADPVDDKSDRFFVSKACGICGEPYTDAAQTQAILKARIKQRMDRRTAEMLSRAVKR